VDDDVCLHAHTHYVADVAFTFEADRAKTSES
jgi:hypothetical protein